MGFHVFEYFTTAKPHATIVDVVDSVEVFDACFGGWLVAAYDTGDVDCIVDAAELRVRGAVEGGNEVWVGDVAIELQGFCVGVVFLQPCSGVCKKTLVGVCNGYAFASSLSEGFGDSSANAWVDKYALCGTEKGVPVPAAPVTTATPGNRLSSAILIFYGLRLGTSGIKVHLVTCYLAAQ